MKEKYKIIHERERKVIAMQKHILVVSQYFFPEPFRISDICQEWVKRGYKVTVLTGIPNYPEGVFYEGYGWFKRRKENWNGVEIIRIPLIPRGKKSLQLVMNYFSFVFFGFFKVLFSEIKADYVFTFQLSPLTQALLGVWYAKKIKKPHYLYVQDLWPESVETVTGIKSVKVINAIQKMADYVYENSTHIFATSPSFVQKIQNRITGTAKVHYWPQYAEEFYKPVDKKEIDEIFEDDSLKIGFTGNIGYAQGLEILPKTATILKEKKCDVRFCIIGDGRYKSELIKELKEKKVEDMFVLIERQPAEKIPQFLAACDIAYLSFMKTELFSMTIPAKLQSYMACGKPILAAASGETERIILDAECGRVVPEGDAEKLADAIIEFSRLPKNKIEECGRNARKYYEKKFEKVKVLGIMEKYFDN